MHWCALHRRDSRRQFGVWLNFVIPPLSIFQTVSAFPLWKPCCDNPRIVFCVQPHPKTHVSALPTWCQIPNVCKHLWFSQHETQTVQTTLETPPVTLWCIKHGSGSREDISAQLETFWEQFRSQWEHLCFVRWINYFPTHEERMALTRDALMLTSTRDHMCVMPSGIGASSSILCSLKAVTSHIFAFLRFEMFICAASLRCPNKRSYHGGVPRSVD